MASRKSATALLVGALLLGTLTLPAKAADGEPGPEGQGARPADSFRKDSVRFAEWVLDAARILAEEHVKEPDEREMIGWAARGLWERFNRTTPPELKRLLSRVKGMQRRELRALLIEVRDQLGRRPELDDLRDVDIALAGIFHYLEPGTRHPSQRECIEDNVCRLFPFIPVGIGARLQRDPASGALSVLTPLKDGPAYRAGIQTGDSITRITHESDQNGRALRDPIVTPTKGLSLEDAVEKICGREGTKVKLTIRRPGAAKEVTIEVTRGRATPETVLGARRKKDDRWDYLIDPQRKIAYVWLTQFSRDTARDLGKVMRELSRAGIKGFILDLRFNPGGLLDSAVKISDLFIDDGMIVTIRPRNGPETSYVGHSDGSYTTFPMVCLVNGYSASASEIVAACLQDHGRAVVMGSRTSGNLSVKIRLPCREGELIIPTAVFHRANGKNLSKLFTSGREDEDWGVRPDKGFALPLPPQERAALHEHLRRLEILPRRDGAVKQAPPRFRDRQLATALAYLRRQIQRAEAAPPRAVRERDWLRPVLRKSPR